MKLKRDKFRRYFRKNFVLLLVLAFIAGSLSACGSKDDWRSREVTVIDDN